MTWNYRVIKTPMDDYDAYSITEVHYDQDGEPKAHAAIWGEYSLNVLRGCETVDDLKATVEMVRVAFDKPVLELVDGKLAEA